MVVYLDLAFLLNGAADALALYVTARLSGVHIRGRRLAAAALLGAVYGTLALLPPLAFLGSAPLQAMICAGLVCLAFGRRRTLLRETLLFCLLSCTLGGALVAAAMLAQPQGGLSELKKLNWSVFFLAGGACFSVLSLLFRGGAKHAVAGEIARGSVELRGRRADFSVLLDTGCALTDGLTGAPVLAVYREALSGLFTPEERSVLRHLKEKGPVWCLERLEPGRWRLLPYRAVGVESALLLCFTAENVRIGARERGRTSVALTPTELAGGGGIMALWGGERGDGGHAA